VKLAQCSAVVVGVALMAMPAVAGYVDTPAGDLHRTVGPLAVTFAIIATWPATRDVRWGNMVLAAVLAVAPVFSAHSATATGVGVVAAALIAAATPYGGPDPDRRGDGWRGVVRNAERR